MITELPYNDVSINTTLNLFTFVYRLNLHQIKARLFYGLSPRFIFDLERSKIKDAKIP